MAVDLVRRGLEELAGLLSVEPDGRDAAEPLVISAEGTTQMLTPSMRRV